MVASLLPRCFIREMFDERRRRYADTEKWVRDTSEEGIPLSSEGCIHRVLVVGIERERERDGERGRTSTFHHASFLPSFFLRPSPTVARTQPTARDTSFPLSASFSRSMRLLALPTRQDTALAALLLQTKGNWPTRQKLGKLRVQLLRHSALTSISSANLQQCSIAKLNAIPLLVL